MFCFQQMIGFNSIQTSIFCVQQKLFCANKANSIEHIQTVSNIHRGTRKEQTDGECEEGKLVAVTLKKI